MRATAAPKIAVKPPCALGKPRAPTESREHKPRAPSESRELVQRMRRLCRCKAGEIKGGKMKDLHSIVGDHSDRIVTVTAVRFVRARDPEMGDFAVLTIDGEEYITFETRIMRLIKKVNLPAKIKLWRETRVVATAIQ
jgi:hypothetical protein